MHYANGTHFVHLVHVEVSTPVTGVQVVRLSSSVVNRHGFGESLALEDLDIGPEVLQQFATRYGLVIDHFDRQLGGFEDVGNVVAELFDEGLVDVRETSVEIGIAGNLKTWVGHKVALKVGETAPNVSAEGGVVFGYCLINLKNRKSNRAPPFMVTFGGRTTRMLSGLNEWR